MTSNENYYEYLKSRSRLGLWYRNYLLYPRLCKHLKGHTLDVGCGIGDFLKYRPNTTGVDVNPSTVEWCQQQGLSAQLMPFDKLPFDDHSFESAILDNVLEHLLEPDALLAEINRVLNVNGCFIVGVPGEKGYASDDDHKVFYDKKLLIKVLSKAGFSLRYMMQMPLPIPWLGKKLSSYCLYGVFVRDE